MSSIPILQRISPFSWSAVPRLLWDTYTEYLWNHQPGSWVGRTASTFRVLALVVVLPVVILTLLDVTSYVIARTLGIVDDVKASTSDATGGAISISPSPSTAILMEDSPPLEMSTAEMDAHTDPSAADSGAKHQRHSASRRDHAHGNEDVPQGQEEHTIHNVHEERSMASRWAADIKPQAFFAGEEDLQLAGVGVFSPAASQTPSPVIPRIKLNMSEGDTFNMKEAMGERDGTSLRRRPRQ